MLQPVEDPIPQQMNMPSRKLQPVESPHWRMLLTGTVVIADPLGQSYGEGL